MGRQLVSLVVSEPIRQLRHIIPRSRNTARDNERGMGENRLNPEHDKGIGQSRVTGSDLQP